MSASNQEVMPKGLKYGYVTLVFVIFSFFICALVPKIQRVKFIKSLNPDITEMLKSLETKLYVNEMRFDVVSLEEVNTLTKLNGITDIHLPLKGISSEYIMGVKTEKGVRIDYPHMVVWLSKDRRIAKKDLIYRVEGTAPNIVWIERHKYFHFVEIEYENSFVAIYFTPRNDPSREQVQKVIDSMVPLFKEKDSDYIDKMVD